MVAQTGISPEDLKNAVCSPGGSTLAGIAVLEGAGFTDTVSGCVKAAYKRNKELGKK
jgi:pyrroline-5-carboxylate reductase